MGNTTFYVVALMLVASVSAETSATPVKLVTQTVYGFLDFITTIGNTVMIFSPETAPVLGLKDKGLEIVKVIETKPINSLPKESNTDISPTKLFVSELASSKNTKLSSIKKNINKTTNDTAIFEPNYIDKDQKVQNIEAHIESYLNQPEYDMLSRQPTEYIEESYRIMNLDTSSRNYVIKHKTITSDEGYINFSLDTQTISPVMKINRNAPKNNITNVRETSFKSTGRRASAKKGQNVQNTLEIYKNRNSKISLPSTPRILKTLSPLSSQETKRPSETSNHLTSKGLRPQLGMAKKNRDKSYNPVRETLSVIQKSTERPIVDENHKKSFRRSKTKRRNKLSRNHSFMNSPHQSTSTNTLKPKSHELSPESETSLSVYMFKLNRAPGRWQYKTSAKPKVNIRKPVGDNSISYTYSNETISTADQVKNSTPKQDSISDHIDLEPSGSQNGAVVNNANIDSNKYIVETINIEISTPADFQDKYYEIATIKTPYTFQAGVLKKTRFITVTSTVEKILEPFSAPAESFDGPLTENILQATKLNTELLDGSITTLSPIFLTNTEETPSLEILTETYTFTQHKLGTEVVPIVNADKNNTSFITAIQTFAIKNLITVTKTVLHGLDDQFVSLNNLKDFNFNLDEAGSEINLELDFGDQDNSDSETGYKLTNQRHVFNISSGNLSQLSASVDQNHLKHSPVSNLYNLESQIQPMFTNTHAQIKPQSLWESYVVQIKNGPSTSLRTLSKLIGVLDKTDFNIETITPAVDPQMTVNPFVLQPQFQTITTQLVQQEIVTETKSKILKLTFGAKTAFTTLFSTNVLPKLVTSYVTTLIPVQHTPTFPGYYPPPYHPFQYVG